MQYGLPVSRELEPFMWDIEGIVSRKHFKLWNNGPGEYAWWINKNRGHKSCETFLLNTAKLHQNFGFKSAKNIVKSLLAVV